MPSNVTLRQIKSSYWRAYKKNSEPSVRDLINRYPDDHEIVQEFLDELIQADVRRRQFAPSAPPPPLPHTFHEDTVKDVCGGHD